MIHFEKIYENEEIMPITPNQFKRGSKIEVDGEPYAVIEWQHIKCGRGGATVRTKIKNLISGRVLERTYDSGEKLKEPDFEEKRMQYLYHDGTEYIFMDQESYEQVHLDDDCVGDAYLFMPESLDVAVQFFNGKPIGITLPNFVELEVTECEPGVKGDTVTGGSKGATVITGGKIQVPLFINEGDVLKIDTRDASYIERVSTKK